MVAQVGPDAEGRERAPGEDPDEGLRDALFRLTQPRNQAVLDQIERLEGEITRVSDLLETLRGLEAVLETRLERHQESTGEEFKFLAQELSRARKNLAEIEANLSQDVQALQVRLQEATQSLREELIDSQATAERIRPVMVEVIGDRVLAEERPFAEAVAPVIGPAIRHQIRSAKQDLIDALYPIIGQIINKAMTEALRELTRKIDTRLRRQLDFRSRLSLGLGRLRGVSEAEQILREALPYQIQHAFLIHRASGLLLTEESHSQGMLQDPELVSGMLTAIRDFVRDSFQEEDSDLEEIAYGDQRILLEAGQHAYLAIVLEGVEPEGYHVLVRETIARLHLDHENSLLEFNGDMEAFPDLRQELATLLAPEPAQGQAGSLSAGEKRLLVGALLTVLLGLSLAAFACLMVVRLWPLAFPSP